MSPAKTCLMRLGCSRFASHPPKIPPTKTPGIKSRPVRQDTNPALAYAKNANNPVGGISAIKLVPCARCCPNAKSSTKKGTKRTPPPIPNSPEATPQIHAAKKIPVLRSGPSATGEAFRSGWSLVFRLRFSPKQKRGQHQKATEELFELA